MIYDTCTKITFLFTVTFDVSPRINAAGRGDVLQRHRGALMSVAPA